MLGYYCMTKSLQLVDPTVVAFIRSLEIVFDYVFQGLRTLQLSYFYSAFVKKHPLQSLSYRGIRGGERPEFLSQNEILLRCKKSTKLSDEFLGYPGGGNLVVFIELGLNVFQYLVAKLLFEFLIFDIANIQNKQHIFQNLFESCELFGMFYREKSTKNLKIEL